MTLSIPTLQFTDLIVFLTCGIVFLCGWFLRTAGPAYLLFAASFVLCAAMSVGFDDFGFYASALAPLGWSLAGSLFWVGFRLFDGRPALTWWMAALTALPTLLHLALTAAGAGTGAVNAASTLAYAAHEAAVAHYVLSTAHGSTLRRVAGGALLAIVAAICLPLLRLNEGLEHLSIVLIVVIDHVTSIVLTTAILAMEAERAHKALEALARRDPLTGTLNRDGFERELRGRHGTAGIIVADLDHFKAVNDRFGHAAGDHVLRKFTRRAAAILPEDATIARFGGEEFVLALPGHDRGATLALAEHLRHAIQGRPIAWNDQEIAVTVSLGVTTTDDLANVAPAIERADAALYAAKNAGRNRLQVA